MDKLYRYSIICRSNESLAQIPLQVVAGSIRRSRRSIAPESYYPARLWQTWRSGEASALGGEAADQGGGLQGLDPRPFGVKGQPVADVSEPQLVGVEHRPAPPHGPAIAV